MIRNQEIEPAAPAVDPTVERSIPLGTQLKTMAEATIAAAGVSLALISATQAQEAPGAQPTPAPKSGAETPGANLKIGPGTLVEEPPKVIEPLQVGITTYSSKYDTPDDPVGFYDHME